LVTFGYEFSRSKTVECTARGRIHYQAKKLGGSFPQVAQPTDDVHGVSTRCSEQDLMFVVEMLMANKCAVNKKTKISFWTSWSPTPFPNQSPGPRKPVSLNGI